MKYESREALIYLKQVQSFYHTEHNPMLCWTGSGYAFSHIREDRIGATPVMTGTLKKGSETLYTLWWYDNGHYRTVSQTAWRWRALRSGQDFTIINITAGDKERLYKEAERVLHDQPFAAIL
jgi:exosortase N